MRVTEQHAIPPRRRTGRRATHAMVLALALMIPAASARAGTFRTILVDGDLSDWDGVAPVFVDATGDQGAGPMDLWRASVVNDDRFVSLRFDIGQVRNLQALPAPLRIYVDVDDNPATGYFIAGIGSDLLIDCSGQGSGISVWAQTAGNFNAAYVGHAGVSLEQAPTWAAGEFEMHLRRGVVLPQSGLTTFAGGSFRLFFDGSGDRAPDADGGIVCTIEPGTPVEPVAVDLARTDPWHVRIVSWNTHGELFTADSVSFRRILAAIGPDVIGFQELGAPSSLVAARLDRDLPLGGGAHWSAFSASPGEVTASRWPQAALGGTPSRTLGTVVDLPDASYPRDLVVLNGHWKCCGSIGTSEDAQRQETADATVDWIRDLRSGGVPYQTPFVILGDLNLVGGPQPLYTVLEGDILNQAAHGPDFAPDWDGSVLTRVAPTHADARSAYTWRDDTGLFVPGMLDHVIISDAVAGVGRRFVLDTRDMPAGRLASYGLLAGDSPAASDHLPVVVDLAPGEPFINGVGTQTYATRLDLAPNPVRSRARVRFELAEAGNVRVDVFDAGGRRVRTLAHGPFPAGAHRVWWDVREEGGAAAKSGVYFVRVELETRPALLRRLVVVR